MKISLYDYCAEQQKQALLDQWHPDKNSGLSPFDVSYGSKRMLWWRCEKGHEWQAQVRNRCYGQNCPVCQNRSIVVGDNDLASNYPGLAAEWHPEKNGSLIPESVARGSRKRVWWRCGKGHEWQATVYSRTRGGGCPICANREVAPGENDLASQFPHIAAQWHPTKNGVLHPNEVTPFANRRAWWLCENGHEYLSQISHRTGNNSGCPYCSGRLVMPGFNDLATKEPKIAAQWHPTLNGALTPEMVTVGSTKKIWWVCEEGHVWKAVVYSRAAKQKCGCPVCAGNVKKKLTPNVYEVINKE